MAQITAHTRISTTRCIDRLINPRPLAPILLSRRLHTHGYASSTIAYAEEKKTSDRRVTPDTPPSKDSRRRSSSSTDSDDQLETELSKAIDFRLLDWELYKKGWNVPWGAKETGIGMVSWAASFVGVSLLLFPIVNTLLGPDGFQLMGPTGRSYFILINQIAETLVGITIVRLAVSKYQPLDSSEFFKLDFRSPLRAPDGWLVWGLLGALLSPVVVYISALVAASTGLEDLSSRGTVDAVSQLLTLDLPTFLSLFTTTAILAPVLEETIFRGFLLPSLSKYMPTPAAVIVSAIAFGLVHLTPRDFPQLTGLGILMGFSYVRSRNLLTPMMIHGIWNGGVLTLLYVLTSCGVDIQEILHG